MTARPAGGGPGGGPGGGGRDAQNRLRAFKDEARNRPDAERRAAFEGDEFRKLVAAAAVPVGEEEEGPAPVVCATHCLSHCGSHCYAHEVPAAGALGAPGGGPCP
jgi:hypothetical protein